jgi:hypothetical protein
MKRIVLISCVSNKGTKKTKAKDLYKGPLFESSLEFAISLKPDNIYILSALHHLIELDKEIEPYNVTLSKPAKSKAKPSLKVLTPEEKNAWGKKVIEQLKLEADLVTDEITFLASKAYIEPIEKFMNHTNIKKPLEGKKYGERVKFMRDKSKL